MTCPHNAYRCVICNITLCSLFPYHASDTSPQKFSFETFGHTDFKYVDNLPDNQMLKGLKVWPVTEIVTYGFNYAEAPLHTRGETPVVVKQLWDSCARQISTE
jgi:hypothetical protein